jgi:hypothetical protein
MLLILFAPTWVNVCCEIFTPNAFLGRDTGCSKSHAICIKIFIDGYNSVQSDWINKHIISLWLFKSPRRSRHVVTCLRQSISWLKTVEMQGFLFHKCIVEHCLASLSSLTCQNECRDTFRDYPGAKQIDNIPSGEQFPWQRKSSPDCIKHEENSECMHRRTRWTFPTLNITFFFVLWFQCNLFFDK